MDSECFKIFDPEEIIPDHAPDPGDEFNAVHANTDPKHRFCINVEKRLGQTARYNTVLYIKLKLNYFTWQI